jgi:tetratricopeptide (TPR) repeat protein
MPPAAGNLNNLGSAYFALGEKQKAKKYFQPAHALFNQFFGPAHPNTKTVAQWLAACDAERRAAGTSLYPQL